jgi:hypothetical protein
MTAQTDPRSWLIPAAILVASIVLGVYIYSLPYDYNLKHEWPDLAWFVAIVFGFYGAGGLLFAIIPRRSLPRTLLTFGVAMMLACWLITPSVAGVIVGAVATLIGGGMMAQPRISRH